MSEKLALLMGGSRGIGKACLILLAQADLKEELLCQIK